MNIGITGHRRLENQRDWGWVDEEMCREIDRFATPLVAVTCLAVGADQIFATSVLARGGRLLAIIPFADYERTFSVEEAVIYRNLLSQAEVEVLRISGVDEDAYLAAGLQVIDKSDVLFAVWNGQSSRGKGGTADIVNCARQKNVPCVIFNPISRTVTKERIPD